MEPFPNDNDTDANLYTGNHSPEYSQPDSASSQFRFTITQTADALPDSPNIDGLSQAIDPQQDFRPNFQTSHNFIQPSPFPNSQNYNHPSPYPTSQNFNQTQQGFQTNMPLCVSPLNLANRRSVEPGQGHAALNHQLVDTREHEHRSQRRRIESRPPVSGHGSDLFQMEHGLGQPMDDIPVRLRRAPRFLCLFPQEPATNSPGPTKQMPMQPEQDAPPEPNPFFPNGVPPGYDRHYYANNAEHGQSAGWGHGLSRDPFQKTAAECPFQPQREFPQNLSEYGGPMSRWHQPNTIPQQQQRFQNSIGFLSNNSYYYHSLENNPSTPNGFFPPQHYSHNTNMSDPQQMSGGLQSMTTPGLSSNTSNVGSFSSESHLDTFNPDDMWAEPSPHSNFDSAEDAPARATPFHHSAPMSGLGLRGWNATTRGSHLQVPVTVSPKQLALRTSPSFESAASFASESPLPALDNDADDGQWFNPPPHVAPAGDEAVPAPNAGDEDPKPAEKPAKRPRGRKALPDGPKPARPTPVADASPSESPSPARRRAKRRHLRAAEEDDLFTPLSDDSDLASNRTTKPARKSKGAPRKSFRLRPEAAAATPAAAAAPAATTTRPATIKPAFGPKAPRYTRPPKNHGVAAVSAAAARAVAPPPQAAPARLGPQTAPPQPRRQTNEHPVPARFASRAESEKFLVASKKAGMTYRAIRKAGGFTEAESTLRGRYRGLTKTASERLRKPEWTDNDVRFFFFCLFFPLRCVALLVAGLFFRQTGVPSQGSGVSFSVTGLPSGGSGVLESISGLPSRVWGVQVDSEGVVDVWSGVSASDPGVNDGFSRPVRTSRSRLSHLGDYPSPVPMASLHPNGQWPTSSLPSFTPENATPTPFLASFGPQSPIPMSPSASFGPKTACHHPIFRLPHL